MKKHALVLVILLSIILVVPTNTQTLHYNITTVVGGASSVGDGLLSTRAQLNYPSSVAISSSGEVYIADTNNHRIRKISTSGIISTIAGTGIGGLSGDGSPATSAQLYFPRGVAISSSGEVYIADTYNNIIRKIATSGIISTIAGTGIAGYNGDDLLATSANLDTPYGVAISPTDEIYIVDTFNHRIRKILASGNITTVAGIGILGFSGDGSLATNAQLYFPQGVAISSIGEIYICDTSNTRIRKVSTNGNITTIAGNGELGYNGDSPILTSVKLYYPSGIAISSSGEVYIADTFNSIIRKISTSGNMSTVVGNTTAGYNGDGIVATSAQLNNPQGIAISSIGEIYITDSYNSRIRKVATSGNISTIAGTNSFGINIDAKLAYAEPRGPPTLQNGNLVFADISGQIRQVNLTTNIITPLVSSITKPTCIHYYNNELYVLYNNYYLERKSSTKTIIAGTGNFFGFSGDGSLATNAQLYYPQGIAISSSGEIYISDYFNHRIRKISTSGIITTIAGTGVSGFSGDGSLATSAQLYFPRGVAISSSGEVYIADTNNHRIRKISTYGNISTIAGTEGGGFNGDGEIATSAKLNLPYGVAISSSGEIYIADSGNQRVRKISTNGNITTIAGNGTAGYTDYVSQATSAQLNFPRGLFISSTGEIYIADYFNHRIRKISTYGTISTIAGGVSDGILAKKAFINAKTFQFSSSGEIYIADTNNHRIRKISNGTITTIAGTVMAGYSGDGGLATSAELNNPQEVAISSTGEIYIADTNNHRIRKISTSGIISTIAGNGTAGYSGDDSLATSSQLNTPQGIAISSSDEIYIADTNNHRIRKISKSGIITTIAGIEIGGFNGDGSLATSAQLNQPSGVSITSNGEIYIADTNNNRIRKLVPWCTDNGVFVDGSCQSTTTQPTTSAKSSRTIIESGSNIGPIVAGVVVSFVLICIGIAITAIIVTVVVWLKKKKKKKKDDKAAGQVNLELGESF